MCTVTCARCGREVDFSEAYDIDLTSFDDYDDADDYYACGARLEGVYESDAMVYFQYTSETSISCILHFCPTCSINMRAELQNMVEYGEKAKLGKHGKS